MKQVILITVLLISATVSVPSFSGQVTTPLHQPTSPPTSELSAGASADPAAGRKHYQAAIALYESGKLKEAINALLQAKKVNPDDAQTHFLLGVVYSKSKAYKDSAESFKRAARLKPDWSEAHFRLGTIYYVLGKKGETIEEYRRLLELNSPLANTLYRIIKDDVGLVEKAKLQSENLTTAEEVVAVPVSAAVSTPSKGDAYESPANTSTDDPRTAPAVAPAPSPTSPTVDTATTKLVDGSTNATSPTSKESTNAVSLSEPKSIDNASIDESKLTSIYKVGVGDILDIRLLNSATVRSTLYTVIDGGLIDFPIAGGALQVGGLTTEEIYILISSELKRRSVEEGARVSVGVRQYASHTVIINGLVGNPGIKVLRREAVPLYVLMAEAQPRLDAAHVTIMRTGSEARSIDLSDANGLNTIVRPGDVLTVSARSQEYYYIAGRVNFPGQKVYQRGITLLQAILAAGGLSRPNDDKIDVSRETNGGRLTTTRYSLKEIKSGKIEDPKVNSGDRIEIVR